MNSNSEKPNIMFQTKVKNKVETVFLNQYSKPRVHTLQDMLRISLALSPAASAPYNQTGQSHRTRCSQSNLTCADHTACPCEGRERPRPNGPSRAESQRLCRPHTPRDTACAPMLAAHASRGTAVRPTAVTPAEDDPTPSAAHVPRINTQRTGTHTHKRLRSHHNIE